MMLNKLIRNEWSKNLTKIYNIIIYVDENFYRLYFTLFIKNFDKWK